MTETSEMFAKLTQRLRNATEVEVKKFDLADSTHYTFRSSGLSQSITIVVNQAKGITELLIGKLSIYAFGKSETETLSALLAEREMKDRERLKKDFLGG